MTISVEHELLACLLLVAPNSMLPEDRAAWISVAKEALNGIPDDLLHRGCQKARQTCRWHGEIVPAILSEVAIAWELRGGPKTKRDYPLTLGDDRGQQCIPQPEPEYIEAEEMQRLIKSIGYPLPDDEAEAPGEGGE